VRVCSPSSHCVDCIYSLVPGKLCNLMVHDAEDRTHIWTGTDNLGALEQLCSLTPSCALDSPLPRSDRSAIHRTPCVHAFARFSNIPASQRRVGQCGRESGSCDHRQQLASGVAGRNSALTHSPVDPCSRGQTGNLAVRVQPVTFPGWCDSTHVVIKYRVDKLLLHL
jgi:hypothetical protein